MNVRTVIIVAYPIFSFYDFRNSPFLFTFAYLISMFSLGILTWSNIRNPFGLLLYPYFGPTSPAFIPG